MVAFMEGIIEDVSLMNLRSVSKGWKVESSSDFIMVVSKNRYTGYTICITAEQQLE